MRVGAKALLIELSKHLERQALSAGEGCLVVSAFQHARYFTPQTMRRYEQLTGRASFVAALGAAIPPGR